MTVWLDVDDLLYHLRGLNRPSGIQRVVYEAGAALRRVGGESVQFVQRGHGPFDFRIVHWAEIEKAFERAMEFGAERPSPSRELATTIVDDTRILRGIVHTQLRSAGAGARLVRGIASGVGRRGGRAARRLLTSRKQIGQPTPSVLPESHTIGTRLVDLAHTGDVFLTLGAPWHHHDYAQTVRWLRDTLRMRFALLIHDLVPLRHPEWCDRGVIRDFRSWHLAILPISDGIFTLSRATASDVERYLLEHCLAPPLGVVSVSAGTVCSLTTTPGATEPVVSGRYVLFVSTIEARKNHALLFRVWRRLLEEMPRDQVPTLVFAGKEGWLVADLMRQLDNTNWLDGKIRFVRNPTDSELRRLYADCLFTVFPSLFEGWGLPVTESLGMGRPCLASNTTSLPEVGGRFARYFNPYDTNDAFRVIRDTIADPEDIQRWTDMIRTEFQPVPWDKSATAILDTLGRGGDEIKSRPA